MGEDQGEQEPHFGDRARDRSGRMEKRVESTVKKGRFQGGKGRQAKRISLEEAEGSMRRKMEAKALKKDLRTLRFTPSLVKPKMGNEVGRRRARS